MSPLVHEQLPEIAIIGVGSMGSAILDGLNAHPKLLASPIKATTRRAESAENLKLNPNVIAHSLENDGEANKKSARAARVIILGVKPWQISDVLTDIAPVISADTIIVSLAAGVTIESMRSLLPEGVSVLRAMPNTPALVSQAVTGLTAGDLEDPEAISLVSRLFALIGKVLVVKTEEQLDALSAVSGSGPAYVFLFIEHLTRAARNLGFEPDEAAMLAEQTFLGASLLLQEKQLPPEELRRQVTSPNGTTEQAIAVFNQAGLDNVFDSALQAATRRAKEIAGGNS